MPRICDPGVPVDVQMALAEEIHAKAATFAADSEDHGSDVQLMVKTLTNRFGDGVTLDTPGVIPSALRRCLKLKAPEAYAKIMQRLIATSEQATPDVLDKLLIPAISALRELARSRARLAGDINALIQAIFTRWAAVVLGQKPAQDPNVFASFAQWNCSCHDCHTAKEFLRKPSLERPTLTLDRIGAPMRKHVEFYLSMYARSVATAETIRRSAPQGLEVWFQIFWFDPSGLRLHRYLSRPISRRRWCGQSIRRKVSECSRASARTRTN